MTMQAILSACAALAGVLFLVVLAGRAARATRLAGSGTGRIKLEESLALDQRRRLVLVSCDGRAVLLLTGAQDHVVGWLPDRAP